MAASGGRTCSAQWGTTTTADRAAGVDGRPPRRHRDRRVRPRFHRRRDGRRCCRLLPPTAPRRVDRAPPVAVLVRRPGVA